MAGGKIRLGTRGSALALAQAGTVAEALGDAELVTIRTSGDEPEAGVRPSSGSPSPGGDKSRFVREIERALLEKSVDLAVHSAKDLPTELPQGLAIAGVPEREDPRDAYVGAASSLAEVPEGATIGTASLRRRAQLLAERPDLNVVEIRGNVDTRIRRLADGDFDGLVLAAAGMRRLGRASEIAFEFGDGLLTPAAGQGALAVEGREGDQAEARAAALNDPSTVAAVACERAAVRALDAGCDTPVGVHASPAEDGRMRVRGFCGLPDGSEWIRDEHEGDASAAERIGHELAERMRGAGAAELLERAAEMAGSAA